MNASSVGLRVGGPRSSALQMLQISSLVALDSGWSAKIRESSHQDDWRCTEDLKGRQWSIQRLSLRFGSIRQAGHAGAAIAGVRLNPARRPAKSSIELCAKGVNSFPLDSQSCNSPNSFFLPGRTHLGKFAPITVHFFSIEPGQLKNQKL